MGGGLAILAHPPRRPRARRFIAGMVAVVVAACGGTPAASPTAAPDDGPSISVTLDAGRAGSGRVGPDGGTVSAVGADGIGYELVVPPAALADAVEIVVTPLSAAAGLPLRGGFAAGADLQPSGLELTRPALLRITGLPEGPAGLLLLGLGYRGTGTGLDLAPAARRDGVVEMAVAHFSGAVAGYGTIEDIAPLLGGRKSDDAQVHFLRFIEAASSAVRDGARELELLTEWMEEAILPALERATDDRGLAQAMVDVSFWNSTPDFYGTYDLIDDGVLNPRIQQLLTDAGRLIRPRALEAAAGNSRRCASEPGEVAKQTALNNALRWLRIASAHDGGIQDTDVAAFAAALCATAVAGLADLDDPLKGSATLDTPFFLDFRTANVVPANFYVEAAIAGGRLDRTEGATALDPPGLYSTEVHPDEGDGQVRIELIACYEHAMFLRIQEHEPPVLCATTLVTRRVDGAPTPPPDCGGRFEERVEIGTADALRAAMEAGLGELGRTGGPVTIVSHKEAALDLARLCQAGGDVTIRGNYGGGFRLDRLDTVEGTLELDLAEVAELRLPALSVVHGEVRVLDVGSRALGLDSPEVVVIGSPGAVLQLGSIRFADARARRLVVASRLETFGVEGITIAGSSSLTSVEFGTIVMGRSPVGLVLERNARLASVRIGEGSTLTRFELQLTQDQRTLPDLSGIPCGTVITGDVVVGGRALLPAERDLLRGLAERCWRVGGRISIG